MFEDQGQNEVDLTHDEVGTAPDHAASSHQNQDLNEQEEPDNDGENFGNSNNDEYGNE